MLEVHSKCDSECITICGRVYEIIEVVRTVATSVRRHIRMVLWFRELVAQNFSRGELGVRKEAALAVSTGMPEAAISHSNPLWKLWLSRQRKHRTIERRQLPPGERYTLMQRLRMEGTSGAPVGCDEWQLFMSRSMYRLRHPSGNPSLARPHRPSPIENSHLALTVHMGNQDI